MKRRIKPVLIGFLLLLIAAAIVNSVIRRGACAYYGYQTDRETRYAALVGCMVSVNGSWVPRQELRIVQ